LLPIQQDHVDVIKTGANGLPHTHTP